MLVGKSNINDVDIRKHCRSYEDYCKFCDSLVPEAYRHKVEIIMNQRYYCALLMRKSSIISWDIKKDLINVIMEKNQVTGFTDTVLEVGLLEDYIDDRKMKKYDRRFSKGGKC